MLKSILKIKDKKDNVNPAIDSNFDKNAIGIMWGNNNYNMEYLKYEHSFPHAYPYTRKKDNSRGRYIKGKDGYWYSPNAKESGKAVLLCTGDLMCEPKQHRANQYGDDYYFKPSFKYAHRMFKGADFVVGNLETTITDTTPYAGEWHRVDGKYHCNAPKSFLDALRYAGFDALVNANNHNCDSAVEGLIDTIEAMDEKNFMHTGTFLPDCEERVLLVKINGIKVGILSYATYFNKLDSNFTQLGKEKLLNEYSREKAIKDIKFAKDAGAEFIISYIHWGKEYTHGISKEQQTKAQELADAGVDYIVGSHSHCLQPHDHLIAKDGRIVPVIYSMGNFVTNEKKSICKHTGVLQLVLEKKDKKALIKSEHFIPCYVFTTIEQSSYAVVPTDIALSGGVNSKTLDDADQYICNVMTSIPKVETAGISIEELCEVLGAKVPENLSNKYASRLCSQPSHVTSKSVFFGIVWNGDTELRDVVKSGACAVVTNKDHLKDIPCIVVDDVKEAYCKVFAHIKNRFKTESIAITGSVGKTTTKRILSNILGDVALTFACEDNWSTRHAGMLAMQKIKSYHEYYIQEVYGGSPESAEMMSKAMSPKYAIITNVDSLQKDSNVPLEKYVEGFTSVADGLKAEGSLIINGDDELLKDQIQNLKGKGHRVITFGVDSEGCDYKIIKSEVDGMTLKMDISHHDKVTEIDFPLPIKVNAYDVLAAFAVAYEEGIAEEQIVKSIAKYDSEGVNQNIVSHNGLTLMLDCRSASPISMKSSIEALCELSVVDGGRRIAVLGDMYLSEEYRKSEHQKIGKFVAKKDIDKILCYGPESKHIYEAAISAGFNKKSIEYFTTKRDLEVSLFKMLQPGDILLVKADRRMYLNSSVRKLFGITASVD